MKQNLIKNDEYGQYPVFSGGFIEYMQRSYPVSELERFGKTKGSDVPHLPCHRKAYGLSVSQNFLIKTIESSSFEGQ